MDSTGLKGIIQEIESDQNKERKADHQKRQDVYANFQRKYVLKMLAQEFSEQTVSEMRTCTSINLTRRIIDQMAAIYKNAPKRTFTGATEAQAAGIQKLYEEFRVDLALKRANQKYKLHEQCTIQLIPKDGKIYCRVLAPHQFDVIPDPEMPERAVAYILSAYDRTLLNDTISQSQDIQGTYLSSPNQSGLTTNQKIADDQDYQDSIRRYVIWTREAVFKVDSDGNILEAQPNPILELPFVDVAGEKDFEYWIKRGSGVVDFNLDFGVVLSDTVNTNRLQSYAQPVIVSEELPTAVTVGPQHILHLKIDGSRPDSAKPSFEFANPRPDLKSSLDLQDRLLNYFLTANGIDPKTITSSNEGQKYNSGLDRLLAMIDKFEASKDDIDLFYCVEERVFDLMQKWYSAIQGTEMLEPEYDFGTWPEETIELSVSFASPEIVTTQADKEKSVVYRMDNGLISRRDAMIELYGITPEEADKRIQEIDSENPMMNLPATRASAGMIPKAIPTA